MVYIYLYTGSHECTLEFTPSRSSALSLLLHFSLMFPVVKVTAELLFQENVSTFILVRLNRPAPLLITDLFSFFVPLESDL